MVALKYIIIMAIVMAATANAAHNYIKAINDLVSVQKSNTCVILVIDGAIQFVATEADAHKELANYGNIARNRNLHVRETFEPLSTKDIIEKLSKIGSTRSTFLIYFTAGFPQPRTPTLPVPHRPAITTGNKNPHTGLFGLAEKTLGLEVANEGLIPFQFNVFGLKPTNKQVVTSHKQ